LRCTKALYETVSGYQNAPQQVNSLAGALSNLETVLRQIRGCKILADPRISHDHVKDLIKRCNNDLDRYKNKLQKIEPGPNGSKARQIWRRSKVVLEEKHIKQIWAEVTQHCTTLGVQLQILQS
jgi:Fungal N-terminal domain of STAND proteins